MALFTAKVSVIDGSGDVATSTINVDKADAATAVTSFNALLELIAPMLEGTIQKATMTVPLTLPAANPPSADPRSDAEYKAVFSFRTAGGHTTSVSIGAFKRTLTNANADTINTSALEVSDFVTSMIDDGFCDSRLENIIALIGAEKAHAGR